MAGEDLQFFEEFGAADGLGQISIEARDFAPGPIGFLGHRRQGEQEGVATVAISLLGTDDRSDIDAVVQGHLDVEDGHVKILGSPEFEGGLPVDGSTDLMAGAPEPCDRDFPVHFIILGHEDA